MLTLHPTLGGEKYFCLNYSLCIETCFFQVPAKQFFQIELKNSQKQGKNQAFWQRKLGPAGLIDYTNKKTPNNQEGTKTNPQTEEFSF